MVQRSRLTAAFERARYDLLAELDHAGHWVGQLSTSALSTATAVSALTLVERHDATDPESGRFADEQRESQLSQLIVGGLRWLADHQNEDGGWGDTDKSYSNIATTMLVVAAFRLTGVPADHADLIERAEAYIERSGGVGGLRKRYGIDRTFAVPILTNCALAGIVPWKEVTPLPFEAACVPQRFYRFLQLPVVSYAIPALVAIGQARFFHHKPLNPLTRLVRSAAVKPSLRVLERIQPESGGYLEAVPLTSFVVMSLAATGRIDHPVTQSGLKFIIESVRADGSWPIDTNLATWNTTLAINALAAAGEDVAQLDCLDWLLSCQYRQVHPFTGAEPGGWGWSDLSGAVPDADDTPGALLALAAWRDAPSSSPDDSLRLNDAALAGVSWLLDLQNRDGGWPTFCRGWGKLPFDRSGADLTAHVLRALDAWRAQIVDQPQARRLEAAIVRGFAFLERRQRGDGSWVPLWFGNQDHADEENPVYGTSKVLAAYRDLGRIESQAAGRGLQWLNVAQNEDGSWGSSVEETALAIEALLASDDASLQIATNKGLSWLVEAVDDGRHRDSSPIGFYFAKLWYYERLYPRILTVSALGQALYRSHPTAARPAQARLTSA